MKQMQKLLSVGLTTWLIASLAGCNQAQTKQNPAGAYEQVRTHFYAQDAFSFYGRTKLLAGQTANANIVNFSGQKQGNDMYMNVKLSFPERKRIDTLNLLSMDKRFYAKVNNEPAWRTVSQGDFLLQDEFNNWNPVFGFRQLDAMRKRVLPINDRNPNDDTESIRVLLDSDKLKAWLAEQMKKQTAASVKVQSTYMPKLKLAMKLSDRDWRKNTYGAQIQAAPTRGDVDELIDHMQIEAECTVYYNRTSMLPTSTVMSIRSIYDMDDQRVHEHTQVETFLQDYGRSKPLPQPETLPKATR